MQRILAVVVGVAIVAAVVIIVVLARRESAGPTRCPPSSSAFGPRCCPHGQHLDGGRCRGKPSSCPPGLTPVTRDAEGCAAAPSRVRFLGGRVQLAAVDWEGVGAAETRTAEVGPFELDLFEVTAERWHPCAEGGVCRRLTPEPEPGAPVTNVTPDEATVLCRFVGGRLPRGDEWLLAAVGTTGRRYPWGATGLVCRRAAFGLVAGPCSEGATMPELAGLRPDGASPEGLLDLVGNVAEWTAEPGGAYRARGGSYRSRLAAELRGWASEQVESRAPHVGFRCAYDVRGPQ